METKQPIASEKEATATVLPKRKASEPFLIPWEKEEPFKLSKEYILQFYEGNKEVKEIRLQAEFNAFYSIEEYSMCVRENGRFYYLS